MGERHDEARRSGRPGKRRPSVVEIEELFRACDQDRDGVLSVSDMMRTMQDFGRQRGPAARPVSEGAVRAALQRLDANGDGIVDFKDFQASLEAGVSWLPEELPGGIGSAAPTTSGKLAEARMAARQRLRERNAEAEALANGICTEQAKAQGLTDTLAASIRALEALELISAGDDVQELQAHLMDHRLWLKRLHEAAKIHLEGDALEKQRCEDKLQSRNRRVAEAMAEAAEAKRAQEIAEAELTKLQSEWVAARSVINTASDAAAEYEDLRSSKSELETALEEEFQTRSAWQSKTRMLEAQGDILREEVARLEAAACEAAEDMTMAGLRHQQAIAALEKRLQESEGQVAHLENTLLERSNENRTLADQQSSQQRQLELQEERHLELIRGQREIQAVLQGGGLQGTGHGGLAAEAQVAEVETLLEQLTLISQDLHDRQGGEQDELKQTMDAMIEGMDAKVDALMKAQLGADQIEAVMAPLKVREELELAQKKQLKLKDKIGKEKDRNRKTKADVERKEKQLNETIEKNVQKEKAKMEKQKVTAIMKWSEENEAIIQKLREQVEEMGGEPAA